MKAKPRGSGWLVAVFLFSWIFSSLLLLNPKNSRAEETLPATPASFTLPLLPQEELGPPLDEPELSMHGAKTTFYARRNRRMHQGLDLKAKVGMALYAAEAGEVHAYWMSAKSRRGGGYTIAVITPQWLLRYLHVDYKLSEARLRAMREAALIDGSQPGDPFWVDGEGRLFVSRGVLIGYSGRTGRVAPHLHFQINPLEGPSVNPLRFYTKTYLAEINDHPLNYPSPSQIKTSERKTKVKVKVENCITNYGPLEVRLFVDSGPSYQWQLVNFNGNSSREAVFEVEISDNQPHTLSVSVVDNQYARSYARSKVSYLRQWWQDSNRLEQQVGFARAEIHYTGQVEVKKVLDPNKETQAETKGKVQ